MPIVTVPSPLSAIHSCDEVYFRFSGRSTAVSWRAWPTRLGHHAPSVRLPEKLAAIECRVFLRRGQYGLLSRAPSLARSFCLRVLRGLTPSAPALASLSHAGHYGPGESTPASGSAATAIYLSFRWNDFGRVNASSPRFDSVHPRPESLTPVQASAGSR